MPGLIPHYLCTAINKNLWLLHFQSMTWVMMDRLTFSVSQFHEVNNHHTLAWVCLRSQSTWWKWSEYMMHMINNIISSIPRLFWSEEWSDLCQVCAGSVSGMHALKYWNALETMCKYQTPSENAETERAAMYSYGYRWTHPWLLLDQLRVRQYLVGVLLISCTCRHTQSHTLTIKRMIPAG